MSSIQGTLCRCGRGNYNGNIMICYFCMTEVKDPKYKRCDICNIERIPFFNKSCYKCICGGCLDRNVPGLHSCAIHKCRIQGCKEAVVKHHITALCYTHTCKRVACFNLTTTDNGYCYKHNK